MKQISKYLVAIVALINVTVISGCTHNNGDIGLWFGQWKVESITTTPGETTVLDNMFWSFASDLFHIVEVQPNHERIQYWAKWKQPDESTLELTFDYSNTAGSIDSYTPPAITGMHRGTQSLHIDTLTSKRLQLTYQADNGITYTYKLIKW